MAGQPACKLDWAGIGGEAGPGARPCDIGWMHDIKDQLIQAQGTRVFIKQLGRRPFIGGDPQEGEEHGYVTRDPKGGDMAEWPEGLRVREWPR